MTQPPAPRPDRLAQRLREGDEHFAVTGATGWFGRTTLDLLHDALGPRDFDRRVRCYASAGRPVRLRSGHVVGVRALDELPATAAAGCCLLHFAALTREKVARLGVRDYVQAGLEISFTVLRAIQTVRPAGLLFTSSGAAYGAAGDGSLETDLQANPYGALKHLDELSLRRACADAGARIVVSRVFSVSGPHINKPEVFALADLVTQALAGDGVHVRARGQVWRSYSAVRDVVAVGLSTLLSPGPPEVVFDTGGPRVEMGELAERIARLVGRPGLPVRREPDPAAPSSVYVGDGRTMEALAERHGIGLLDLDAQILATADHLAPPASPTTREQR